MANKNNGGEVKNLVATCPILYLSHQYNEGDVLPASNEDMVDAWLQAGTAKWVDGSKSSAPEPAKAVMACAEPGIPGSNVVSTTAEPSDEHLIGRVPKTGRRKK